jgi:hypothetical protein
VNEEDLARWGLSCQKQKQNKIGGKYNNHWALVWQSGS